MHSIYMNKCVINTDIWIGFNWTSAFSSGPILFFLSYSTCNMMWPFGIIMFWQMDRLNTILKSCQICSRILYILSTLRCNIIWHPVYSPLNVIANSLNSGILYHRRSSPEGLVSESILTVNSAEWSACRAYSKLLR